ncbi:uncharacterized protein LOC125492014 [Beta vulgaris subsp. vulgaris]|uniref:uncharacterized protein LOC125492014 n=1 Tax=Beta vulgaris subsp. vulgaris TaxID=3555 RepID=UPI0020371ACA|nr:uncharacterized protein LOC125492014 [Beta vulgaris subsp. vulgaris]
MSVSTTISKEGHVLTSDQQRMVCGDFTEEDVKRALFAIEDNKASGPDGYTSHFFKKAWSCIDPEITAAILNFFQTVDPVQSAFVEDRRIMHNILICQDMLKMYKRKELPARCTIKVDLRKAYDSLSWSFIEELLCGLKFPKKFVDWLMQCITTTSYSLSINGSICGFFSGKRGIRQGDPISPLIFVLAMEYLTRLMKKMSKRAEFKYHYRCESLKLTHIIFADDLMMFCKGDPHSVALIVRTLKAFTATSGLEASPAKSAIYFGNVKVNVQYSILRVFGYNKGEFPFHYLGVPITTKKLKRADCDVLVDKILKQIMCWSSRHLSYAARVTLVNSVLLSLHIYWTQIFLLHEGVLNKIVQICKAFLWEGRVNLLKIPPVANKEDSLWIKWIHCVYLREMDWWTYEPLASASWGWKAICRVKNIFKVHILAIDG